MSDAHTPDTQWTLYRSKISYFSGKLEAYLHYKNIPFNIVEVDRHTLNKIYKHTGIKKMPAMEAEGTWLFDTTPTIAWLETHYGGLPVLPDDPALAFISLLIEDYGDEWLWRPAMWWRWIPMNSRRTLGWTIGADIIEKAVSRQAGWLFAKRQAHEWLWDDGMNAKNENTVRDMYFRELEFLEPLFDQQAFILGSHPSVADYGYFASMFRHFGNDPDSAEIMRMQAPNTYEWVARLWNAKPHKLSTTQTWVWPTTDHWRPLLDRIANDYLPYLQQNAQAYLAGKKRFNYVGKHHQFSQTKTTHYRVWCYEILQKKFDALTRQDQEKVYDIFNSVGGLNALTEGGIIQSGMHNLYNVPAHPPIDKPSKRLKVFLAGQARN